MSMSSEGDRRGFSKLMSVSADFVIDSGAGVTAKRTAKF